MMIYDKIWSSVQKLTAQMTKAMISKPAPAFSGTSVLNGEFKELKLTDYLGEGLSYSQHPEPASSA